MPLITNYFYKEYLQALIDGDRNKCKSYVQQTLDWKIDIRNIYVDLFQRSLYDVGELWETNKISVATEHLATTITSNLMTMTYPAMFSDKSKEKKAIVTSIMNEHHQIGGRMVADIMELNGWNTYYLGADTPVEDLLNLIDQKEPDLVGLSLAIYFNLSVLISSIISIRERYPKLQIIVGGQAFRHGGSSSLSQFSKVKYISSLYELEQYLEHYS